MVWKEIEQLRRLTVGELRVKYLEVFGQPSRSNHKQFLFRRVAWRLQAQAYGDLSDQARQQALAIAQDVELRIKAPAHLAGPARRLLQPTLRSRYKPGRDARVPKPGSFLQREFKGQMVIVQVLADGFQYQDRHYKSLSAIARQVTGTAWNGYSFFRLKTTAGESQ
jgi:Protein of unknown function (DUF2924)